MTSLESQLALAENYKRKLRAQETRLAKQAERAFRASVRDFLGNLRDASRTSPEGLDGVDVRDELAAAMAPARERAAAAITEAYTSGRSLGLQAVVAEMGLLDVEYRHAGIQDTLLSQALRDLSRNFDLLEDEAARAISSALADASLRTQAQRMHRIAKDVSRLAGTMSRRAALGARTAANRAYTDGQLSVRPVERVRKMWVANFQDGPPCLTCAALHGTVLAMSADFDPEHSYAPSPPRVYRDLAGPPRHPNCRCRLVLVPDPKDAESDRMRRYADRRVVESVLESGFTAAQARSWPWAFVNRLTGALRAVFRRKRS